MKTEEIMNFVRTISTRLREMGGIEHLGKEANGRGPPPVNRLGGLRTSHLCAQRHKE